MKSNFSGYSLLDSGDFQKLERIGPYLLVRPALQAIWKPRLSMKEWQNADARFERDESGKGIWHIKRSLPAQWTIQQDGLSFVIRLTDFGHIGIFPEHFQEWQILEQALKRSDKKPFKCLNLFAYTGAMSLQLARHGAHVVHIDASKKSVDWARENAHASSLEKEPVRWIVEDVRKFVNKEMRRSATYEGIILDPPSFGRGPQKQLWKIEDHMRELLSELSQLCSPEFSFLFLTSHTPGITGLVLRNLVEENFPKTGKLHCGELAINEASTQRKLPSGSFCLWERTEATR